MDGWIHQVAHSFPSLPFPSRLLEAKHTLSLLFPFFLSLSLELNRRGIH